MTVITNTITRVSTKTVDVKTGTLDLYPIAFTENITTEQGVNASSANIPATNVPSFVVDEFGDFKFSSLNECYTATTSGTVDYNIYDTNPVGVKVVKAYLCTTKVVGETTYNFEPFLDIKDKAILVTDSNGEYFMALPDEYYGDDIAIYLEFAVGDLYYSSSEPAHIPILITTNEAFEA